MAEAYSFYLRIHCIVYRCEIPNKQWTTGGDKLYIYDDETFYWINQQKFVTWKVLHICQMTTFWKLLNMLKWEMSLQFKNISFDTFHKKKKISCAWCPDGRFSYSHSFDSDRKIESKIISIWNDLYGAIKCASKQAINILNQNWNAHGRAWCWRRHSTE